MATKQTKFLLFVEFCFSYKKQCLCLEQWGNQMVMGFVLYIFKMSPRCHVFIVKSHPFFGKCENVGL